jgi:hypothetical protein
MKLGTFLTGAIKAIADRNVCFFINKKRKSSLEIRYVGESDAFHHFFWLLAFETRAATATGLNATIIAIITAQTT